jgi:hypothetical protein
MNHRALRIITLLLCAAHLPTHASTPENREWRFEVLLDDKPIGFHQFNLNTTGDTRELRGEAQFRVKLLGLTVYRYSHSNLELWEQECLQHIDASTNKNGKGLFVRGSSNGKRLLLENTTGNSSVPGCVMTFAYWNPEILGQQRLLNAQTGEYLDVSVQHLGEKKLRTQDGTVPALHYRISTEESDIDLWYTTDRDWLALSTTISGGRQLYYRRITTAVDTWSGNDE